MKPAPKPQKDSIVSEPLVREFAKGLGVSPAKLLKTLAATVMPEGATGEQVLLFLHLAKKYGLDPMAGQISAWPDGRGGIQIVVRVDGWIAIAASHPEFDGVTFTFSDETVDLKTETFELDAHGNVKETLSVKKVPLWCTATVRRKDLRYPVEVTEYFDEVYQAPPPFWNKVVKTAVEKGKRPPMWPWHSHPRRMLRHKTLIQALRLAFGLTGIYDPDEAIRIQHERAAEVGADVDIEPARLDQLDFPPPRPTVIVTEDEPETKENAPAVTNGGEEIKTGADRVRAALFRTGKLPN